MVTKMETFKLKLIAAGNLFLHGLTQLFISFDQLLNVWLFPFSWNTWADETFSSRCGRLQHRYPYKIFGFIVDILFYFQNNDLEHCRRAYEKEKKRYQLPPEMRQ